MMSEATDKAALIRLAKEADARRDWFAALLCWGTCLDAFPADIASRNWRVSRANALLALGREDEAEAAFLEVANAAPNFPPAHLGLARVAERKEDWDTALSRYDECLDRFQAAANAVQWRVSRAQVLMKLGRVAEAEAIFEAHRDVAARASAGWARCAERRDDWLTAAERWANCLARFGEADGAPQWRHSRAISLARARRWREASEAWSEVAAERNLPAARVQRASCLFEAEGPTERVIELVREAIDADPQSTSPLRLHARVLAARREWREALRVCEQCIDTEPEEIQGYAMGMSMAAEIGDCEAADRLVAKAPASLAQTRAFKARVSLQRLRASDNVIGGLQLIDDLGEGDDDLPSTVVICGFLGFARRFGRQLEYTERAIMKFPPEKSLARIHLYASYRGGGRSVYEAAKAAIFADADGAWRTEVLLSVPVPWLSREEMRARIDWLLSRSDLASKAVKGVLGFLYSADSEIMDYLTQRLSTLESASMQIACALFSATAADRARVLLSSHGGAKWQDFQRAAAATASAEVGFLSINALSTNLRRGFALLDHITRHASLAFMSTAESYFQTVSFAEWLVSRIRAAQPTSVVRLSDGEGLFLPYSPEEDQHVDPDRRQIVRIWWGLDDLEREEGDALKARFEEVIGRADAVGVPQSRHLVRDLSLDEDSRWTRGLLNDLEFVDRLPEKSAAGLVITSCYVHFDLQDWDLYRFILAAATSVSFVSCHDLAETLRTRFGVEVREKHLIPPEFNFADMFGKMRGEREPFYPRLFEELMTNIDPRPGELVLVAAGFLGKFICDRVRDRGGIGFDLGAVADTWMGHATREFTASNFDFDLSSSLIEGQPFIDDFHLHAPRGSGPCFSDETRRHDVIARMSPQRLRSAVESQRKLLVTGHPRCGSMYTATVLAVLGLDMGHERLGKDGACSWIHAVEDYNPPCNAAPMLAGDFGMTLAFVRDPENAVASIVVENVGNQSFTFRRFHIWRELGIDIAAHRDPNARAVASLLGWMEIVEHRRPIAALRVERLIEDLEVVSDRLIAGGVRLDWSRRPDAAAVHRTVNSTESMTSVPKPILATGWRDELPSALQDGLARFCERHGYA